MKTNKVQASVKCFKTACILDRFSWAPWIDEYLVAIELESGVESRFITKSPMTRKLAMKQIKKLLQEKKCIEFREREHYYDHSEDISPYVEGEEDNIN